MTVLNLLRKWLIVPVCGAAAFFVFATVGDLVTDKPTAQAPSSAALLAPNDVADLLGSAHPVTVASAWQRINGLSASEVAHVPPPPSSSASPSPTPRTSPSRAPAAEVLGLGAHVGPEFRLRFVDPCAADPAPPGCGGGSGGTIVPLLDPGAAPDPLHIGSQLYMSGLSSDLGRCTSYGTTADGHLHALLFTNNPAHLSMRIYPAGNPSAAVTETYDSTDHERDLWNDNRVAGNSIRASAPYGVQNCLDITGLHSGTTYAVDVTGTDDLGTIDTHSFAVLPGGAPASSGRPPTVVTPVDGVRAKVVATLADHEQLWVIELPHNTPDRTTSSCTDVENNVLRSTYNGYRVYNQEVANLTLPADPYAFDRRYHVASSAEWWPAEGEQATLCTWITTPGAHTFDKPNVVTRQSFEMQAPKQRHVVISVVAGNFSHAQGLNSITAQIEEQGFDSPGITVPYVDTPTGNTLISPPAVIGDSAGLYHPDNATLDIRVNGAVTRTVLSTPAIACPADPSLPAGSCPSHWSRMVTAPLPNGAGTLTIALDISDGASGPPPSTGSSVWVSGASTEFSASAAATPPHFAQLDYNTSGAFGGATSGGRRPSITVRVTTDRPVSATVQALQWPSRNSCGGEPQTQSDLSTTHTFVYDNLCFGAEYDFSANVTDASGVVTSFGAPGTGGTIVGVLFTQQLPISQLSYSYAYTNHQRLYDYGADGTVDGVIVSARPSREEGGPCLPESTGPPMLGTPIVNHTEHGYPIDLPESVPVTFTVDLGTGPYCDLPQRVVLTGNVNLADLISGTPVTLTADSGLLGLTMNLSAVPSYPISPTH